MKPTLIRTSIAISIPLALYLGYLGLIAYRANSLLHDARTMYKEFQSNGFTKGVETKYNDLIPRLNELRKTADNPLIKPLIPLTGREKQLNDALALYDYIAPALPAIPEFIGATSPKRYLVAFQNSAEARGTGGIFGAFAVLKLDKGEFSVEKVGSNYNLQHQPSIPVKLPKEFYNIYRQDPAIWMNSNMSPHFPYGAKIWLGLWNKQFNDNLDGVIALDPIVLSHLLTVTGPVTAEGNKITSENVVAESLSDAYLKFENDNFARKSYLVAIIQSVADAILAPTSDRLALVRALQEPIFENRILLYSTNQKTQVAFAKSKISGAMRKTPSNEYRLVIQNTAGNKMDYYLDRAITIKSLKCGAKPTTEVDFTITNTANKDSYLPAYVKGRLDLNMPQGKENATFITAFLFGPPKAKLLSAFDPLTNGSAGFLKTERTRTALTIPLELSAGESRSFTATFKGGTGALTSHRQPLVRPQLTKIQDRCSK